MTAAPRFTIERRWPAAVIHAGSVYLVGDNADRRASARVDRFEVGAGARAPALPELPGARQSAAAASVGGRVVVVGGRGDGFAASGQVDLFDPATATWSPGPSLAVARAGSCIAVLP